MVGCVTGQHGGIGVTVCVGNFEKFNFFLGQSRCCSINEDNKGCGKYDVWNPTVDRTDGSDGGTAGWRRRRNDRRQTGRRFGFNVVYCPTSGDKIHDGIIVIVPCKND